MLIEEERNNVNLEKKHQKKISELTETLQKMEEKFTKQKIENENLHKSLEELTSKMKTHIGQFQEYQAAKENEILGLKTSFLQKQQVKLIFDFCT